MPINNPYRKIGGEGPWRPSGDIGGPYRQDDYIYRPQEPWSNNRPDRRPITDPPVGVDPDKIDELMDIMRRVKEAKGMPVDSIDQDEVDAAQQETKKTGKKKAPRKIVIEIEAETLAVIIRDKPDDIEVEVQII